MENVGDIIAGMLMAGTPLLIFEAISRHYKISSEITRKSVHALTSLVVVYMTFFLSLKEIAAISGLFLIFFVATRKLRLWKSLFQIKRRSFGEITFPIGVALAALISHDEKIFICAVLIIGLADPAAAIIGQHYRKPHRLLGAKTIEGTAGFLLISSFLLGAFGVEDLITALVIACAASLAELLSSDGMDNITVPLALSLLMNLV